MPNAATQQQPTAQLDLGLAQLAPTLAAQLIALADTVAPDLETIRDAAWDIAMANPDVSHAAIERCPGATWVHLHGVGLHAYIGDEGRSWLWRADMLRDVLARCGYRAEVAS